MTSPDVSNPSVLAQYYTKIANRVIQQSAKVVADAVEEFSDGEHTLQTCVKTMNQLADIALLGGVEIVATTFAGPGFQLLPAPAASRFYQVPDATKQYRVEVCAPLSRFVSADAIPVNRVAIEAKRAGGCVHCPGGVLPPGTAEFRLVVNRTGIHSGCYTGQVLVTTVPADPTAAAPAPMAVDIEL
jgi:hypothetical protein